MVFWPGYLSQDQLRKYESSVHDEARESTCEDRFLCLQEDLWQNTWVLDAQKAFIQILRRLGWILYYYFPIMEQVDRVVKWLGLSEREANFHTKHCLYLESSFRS